MLGWLTVIGLIVLAGLVIFFLRTRTHDQIGERLAKRKASSKAVALAEYLEGMNKIPVAVSVTDTAFFYENPDLEANFDLDRIEEIEYDDETSTGHQAAPGRTILRLRSHGAAFEFSLLNADADKFRAVLPARRSDGPAAKAG